MWISFRHQCQRIRHLQKAFGLGLGLQIPVVLTVSRPQHPFAEVRSPYSAQSLGNPEGAEDSGDFSRRA